MTILFYLGGESGRKVEVNVRVGVGCVVMDWALSVFVRRRRVVRRMRMSLEEDESIVCLWGENSL